MLALWWAAGCRPLVELPDVPIDGGTAEQREIVRAELERFDEWIGPGRLRIRRVRFFEDPHDQWDHAAWWNSARDLVELDARLSGSYLEQAVRHELSHGLDAAEGLSADPAQFERLERLGTTYPRLDPEDSEELRSEAFARMCETGPIAAALLAASTCPTDADGHVADQLAVYAFLLNQVWTGYAAPPPAEWVPEVVGGFRLDDVAGEVDGWQPVPTADPDRLLLLFDVADEDIVGFVVEFATGQPVAEVVDTVNSAIDVPPGLAQGTPEIWWEVGWPEGPAGAAVTYRMNESDVSSPGLRLVYHDGEAWRPIRQGCVLETGIDFALFTARDQVWYAWDDGEAVYWAALGDTDSDPP